MSAPNFSAVRPIVVKAFQLKTTDDNMVVPKSLGYVICKQSMTVLEI